MFNPIGRLDACPLSVFETGLRRPGIPVTKIIPGARWPKDSGISILSAKCTGTLKGLVRANYIHLPFCSLLVTLQRSIKGQGKCADLGAEKYVCPTAA